MDTELFVHFAEIAGVFVGFGALIALRSTRLTDLHDVIYLRAVLILGVWVVVAALLPIAVNRYGVDGHSLWLSCALAVGMVWVVGFFALNLSADMRALNRNAEPVDRLFPIIGLPLHLVIAGSMALIVVGVWPHLDEALYVTGLSAGLVFGGYTLLVSVLSSSHISTSERDDH
ncbi:hypothetical protein [Agromyces bauzanensis]